jgi:hypothetical protein
MEPFGVLSSGVGVTVDFAVNLPVNVWTTFGVWDASADLVASTQRAEATAVGTLDFAFSPALDLPGLLLCRFDCIGRADLVGELLEVRVVIAQGARSAAYEMTPTAMKKGGEDDVPLAQLRKEIVVKLIQGQ